MTDGVQRTEQSTRSLHTPTFAEIVNRITSPLKVTINPQELIPLIARAKSDSELKRSLEAYLQLKLKTSFPKPKLATVINALVSFARTFRQDSKAGLVQAINDGSRKDLMLLSQARVCFSGTDFTLTPSLKQTQSSRQAFDRFHQIVKADNEIDGQLFPFMMEMHFARRNDSDDSILKEAFVRKVYDLLKKHSACITPGSEEFNPTIWLMLKVQPVEHSFAEHVLEHGSVSALDVATYLRAFADGFEPHPFAREIAELERQPNRQFMPTDLRNIISPVVNKLLLQLGLFTSMGSYNQPYTGKIIDSMRRVHHDGTLAIPVDFLFSTNGGTLAEAYSRHSKVYIPIESLISEEQLFEESGAWYKDFTSQKRPSFMEHPSLLGDWIRANIFADYKNKRSEYREAYIQHLLAEELQHARSMAFAEVSMKQNGVSNNNLDGFLNISLALLKPESELNPLLQDCSLIYDHRVELGAAVFELEAKLQAINTSPFTLLTLLESMPSFSSGQNRIDGEREYYDASRLLMLRYLTPEIFPEAKAFVESIDWTVLLKASVNGGVNSLPEAFGELQKLWLGYFEKSFGSMGTVSSNTVELQKIKSAALAAYEKHFLTASDRDQAYPNWQVLYQDN